MNGAFADELLRRSIERMVEVDPQRVALLGFTPASLHVLGAMRVAQLDDRALGIFTDRPADGSVARPLEELADLDPDLLVVGVDAEKAEMLLAYRDRCGDRLPPPGVVLAGTAHMEFRDELFDELNAPALVPSYATGSPHTRVHLFQALQAAAAARLRGGIVEFGAFKGGTTAWLARVAAKLGLVDCPVIGFDSWAGFPPRRSVLDLYEHPRCVFDDIDAVRAYTAPFGVELIPGDISETYRRLDDEPLLLCFYDTDNYSPTHASLDLCVQQLLPGGSIVFDHVATTADYVDTLGERIAAYEALAHRGFLHLHGTGVFTKLPS